jgi:hypothetical protein
MSSFSSVITITPRHHCVRIIHCFRVIIQSGYITPLDPETVLVVWMAHKSLWIDRLADVNQTFPSSPHDLITAFGFYLPDRVGRHLTCPVHDGDEACNQDHVCVERFPQSLCRLVATFDVDVVQPLTPKKGWERYLFAMGDSANCAKGRRYLAEIWPPYILIQVLVSKLQTENHGTSFHNNGINRSGHRIAALLPECIIIDNRNIDTIDDGMDCATRHFLSSFAMKTPGSCDQPRRRGRLQL